MTQRRIAIVGGGPAGLFAARLLARDHPDWRVEVYERRPRDDAEGFGVGLTAAVLRALHETDPEIAADLEAAVRPMTSALFRLPQGDAELPSSHAGGIAWARLLEILARRAHEAGASIAWEAQPDLARLRRESDLLVGADGVSSLVRADIEAEIGVSEERGRGSYVWTAAEVALDGTIFQPVHTDAGTFVAHAYPYTEQRSTFVVETDAATLRRFLDGEPRAPGDETGLAALSTIFDGLLQGRRFLEPGARWLHFRTISCELWHHENVVLLGDAAATAHPSLGSGTKLALEAAIALAAALSGTGDHPPSARLGDYERRHRPQVDRLQGRARRSQLWWESFPARLHLPPARLATGYLSRAGAVSLEVLHRTAPELARQAAAEFAQTDPDDVPRAGLSDWVLQRPLSAGQLEVPGRVVASGEPPDTARLEVSAGDAWAVDGDALVARAAAALHTGATAIELVGPPTRSALLDRLALGERLRLELGAVVAVRTPRAHLEDAVDGLVAGRVDLVSLVPSDR